MFDEWRKGLLKKNREEASNKFWDSYTEEEREVAKQRCKKEYEDRQKELKENYKRWDNLEDLDKKQWIKDNAENFLEQIKKINRKYYWRHPVSSIWTGIYIKWFNWFYLIPKNERIGKNDEEFIKSMIAVAMKRLDKE